MKYINRLRYIPLGLIEGSLSFLNRYARDIENRKRFSNSIIDSGCTISQKTKIGQGTHILSSSAINSSEIGNYTYIGKNSLIQNTKIGNYCSIANDVNIGLGRHPLELVSTSPLFYRKKNTFKISIIKDDLDYNEYLPINIGHDVWIGTRATIMGGIAIGNGAVIAAGAIVTKDVAPYSIVGGVPASLIRYRFEKKKIEQILQSMWWTLEPKDAYLLINNL